MLLYGIFQSLFAVPTNRTRLLRNHKTDESLRSPVTDSRPPCVDFAIYTSPPIGKPIISKWVYKCRLNVTKSTFDFRDLIIDTKTNTEKRYARTIIPQCSSYIIALMPIIFTLVMRVGDRKTLSFARLTLLPSVFSCASIGRAIPPSPARQSLVS